MMGEYEWGKDNCFLVGFAGSVDTLNCRREEVIFMGNWGLRSAGSLRWFKYARGIGSRNVGGGGGIRVLD